MNDLREQLQHCLCGRVCIMALGSIDCGDDAFGVRLGEELLRLGVPSVIVAGTEPDRYIGRLAEGRFDRIVFLDAVDFGAAPGSVVLLDTYQISARYPQVSTHKLSLGIMAKWIEARGTTKVWLLGAQPGSIKAGQPLTPTIRATIDLLCGLLREVMIGKIRGGTAARGRSAERAEEVTV